MARVHRSRNGNEPPRRYAITELAVWEGLPRRHPDLAPLLPALQQVADVWTACFRSGHKLLLAGNGGSAADADHISAELLKGFKHPRPLADGDGLDATDVDHDRLRTGLQRGLPALPLPQFASLLTAFGNDVDPALGFAQLVLALGQPGDVLVAISTSGNSESIRLAAKTARARGLTVVGFTGATGGELRAWCDHWIGVPRTETFEVQELHLPCYHALCLAVEARIFGGD